MTHIAYLDDESPRFPPTSQALTEEPAGLLAVGGNLAPDTLLHAYTLGIFPWYSPGEPILWWSPSPRMSLVPSDVHISKSLKKLAKKKPYKITVDSAFDAVISNCANVERRGQQGTWISNDMRHAYASLHEMGYAHSVEAWRKDELVGGLYGLAIGSAFFGESMFSKADGASKIAFASLCIQLASWGFSLVDCQVYTPLLASFGAKERSREQFEQSLACALNKTQNIDWHKNWELGVSGFDGSK